MAVSQLEELLAFQMKMLGFKEPVREYRFDDVRRFRFDFCWPDLKIAVEVEGGIWKAKSGHSGAGYLSDCQKYNLATAQGWKLFRYPVNLIKSGEAVAELETIFDGCLIA